MAEQQLQRITIQLTVTAAQGAPRVPLTLVDPSITPTELRKQAAEATKIPLAAIKIIFRGRLLADSETLAAIAEYKLEEGSVLHCMGKPSETDVAASVTGARTAATLPTVSVQAPISGVASSTVATAATIPGVNHLEAALTVLRTSNSPAAYQTAVTTLDKILSNIIENPMEEKYRALKVQNAAFQRRLGGLPGGDAAIKACGFTVETVDGDDKYCMAASAEKWPALLEAKHAVGQAVRIANLGTRAPPPNFAGGGSMMPGFGGLGDAGGLPPMAGIGSPEMQQAVAQMVSNPERVQHMLQVRACFEGQSVTAVHLLCLLTSILISSCFIGPHDPKLNSQ